MPKPSSLSSKSSTDPGSDQKKIFSVGTSSTLQTWLLCKFSVSWHNWIYFRMWFAFDPSYFAHAKFWIMFVLRGFKGTQSIHKVGWKFSEIILGNSETFLKNLKVFWHFLKVPSKFLKAPTSTPVLLRKKTCQHAFVEKLITDIS